MTGLTSASYRSDPWVPFVGFALGEFLVSCVFGSCWLWSVLGRFRGVLLCFVLGFSSVQVVFWGCLCSRA
jgi:hypothetical protein